MIGGCFGGKKVSARGMYIQSNSDIPPKGKDMRSIADILKLGDIATPMNRGVYR